MRLITGVLAIALAAAGANSSPAATDQQIKQAIADEIGEILPSAGPGGAAVTVRVDGRTLFYNFGTANRSGEPITPDTLFNLASLSKTFDATLLSMMVKQHEVSLDDPIAKYIVELQRGGEIKKVTLGQLVTYSSGFTMPQDRPPWPVTNYTLPKFLNYLKTWKIDRKHPPGQFRYSHAAYMLLHVALERRFGVPYSELLNERLLRPLGLTSTILPLHKSNVAQLPADLMRRAVQNFDENGRPVGKVGDVQGFYHWPGTGQMFSSARDMSVMLAAQLGEISEPAVLRDAVKLAQTAVAMQDDAEDPMHHAQAQAWEVRYDPITTIDKNGALNNTSSYIGIAPGKQLGIVIMSNRGDQYVAKVGRRILLRLSVPESVRLKKLQELEDIDRQEQDE
jgi:beta-lactamase class C